MYKEYMIKCLHLLYRGDAWVNELYNAIGINAETVDKRLDVVYNNMFFDTLNEYGCEVFEKDLGIVPALKATLEQRRLMIKSKWLAKSFCNLPALQSIADVHFSGTVQVLYNGDATLIYKGCVGFNEFDTDVSRFLADVGEIKPAHFDGAWVYVHNVWGTYFVPSSWKIFGTDSTWRDKQPTIWDKHTFALKAKKWSYMLGRTWKETMYKEVVY